MKDHILKKIITDADTAINQEDFDKLIDFYAEDATMVVQPGKNIQGKEALRKAFEAIAAYFNHSLHVSQEEMIIIKGGDTALVISKSTVKATMKTGKDYEEVRKATYIFRKGRDEKWLCVIDNSYGTSLLV